MLFTVNGEKLVFHLHLPLLLSAWIAGVDNVGVVGVGQAISTFLRPVFQSVASAGDVVVPYYMYNPPSPDFLIPPNRRRLSSVHRSLKYYKK